MKEKKHRLIEKKAILITPISVTLQLVLSHKYTYL